MNPSTPPPGDDDLPEERELAALYARLSKDEPDPSLDAVVLARAMRAVPPRRRPRWPVALASAAVLVLAVGVGWQLRDSRPDPKDIPVAIQERIPAPSPGPAAAPAPAPAPVQAPLVAPGVAEADVARTEAYAPAKPVERASKKVMRPAAAPQAMRSAPTPDLGPDDRVGEIRRLLGRGERAEALRRLHELRARYPHYDIPQDLRDLEP